LSDLIWLAVVFALVAGAIVAVRSPRWSRNDDPILLGNPRVKYLVIAGDYSQAVTECGLEPGTWRFVRDTSDLLGYRAGDVKFRLVGTWARNPIFEDPWAFQRLRSLGLHAFPERVAEL
jgi:hypothetical protein